ncbi:hypothetical protein SERLA73DRAFT_187150 [Serpula lacrymans var. lacrymans S7.3]|uniref:Uncharacterized protein n=2 Tax=Serpula lacrymans var. lacrymans TaxID=341189 RepID=F8Q8K1_SERL3|nr:uncharacterized protein SERLADRAFT_476556 [Serpula lacrymans var. lacrymans S7.9]EGN95889.1 hypothetical protein SERLA73DRAFT_187150 [Serpula lacrymans var. lacrymans S7.3]EGO21403.1 hypothetical protein SERLADRAFT_476556 [Serpula lacrymans var. lacrymans S7.9]
MTLNIASCLGLIWGTSRSHIDFVFDATWLSSSLLESMVSESSPSTRAAVPTKDQYHHYIPRFILRRFQVGPRK